jgi:hypothetical protein
MKGLILKDFYVLTKQMRIFLIMIVILGLMPSINTNVFAVVYAAMLPYTALAYDERSHWDTYASMMPYTVRDLVLSKYILGWCFTAAAALIVLAAGEVERQFVSGISASPAATGLALCVGTLATALTLPLMFRFSVERGRMFFLLLVIVLACGSAGLFSGIAEDPAAAVLTRRLVLILPAATILCSVLSVFLSIRLYQKRMTE